MTQPVLPGAEPFSASGGPDGILVLHGYTGSPGSLRELAQAFADAGYTVDLPLLPGHGTSVDDLIASRWDDWLSTAETAYGAMAARCSRVAVAALSMGGALATSLAAEHTDISALVLVNPLIDPPAESFRELLRGVLATGTASVPAVGSDIADPESHELSYDATPIEPLLSLCTALDELGPRLANIKCPTLLFTSRQDHVVPPASSEVLAAAVGGPVEHVWLERSYHVATQDYDKADIEARSIEFLAKAFAAG